MFPNLAQDCFSLSMAIPGSHINQIDSLFESCMNNSYGFTVIC